LLRQEFLRIASVIRKVLVASLVFVLMADVAEAKLTKLYYLRIGVGERSLVYGLKSLKACEAKAAELNLPSTQKA
jgi:hypothetical protein